MDTCHECKDVVEKLNEEFDTLQDENTALKKKIEGLESPKFYYETEDEWNNKWNVFLENLNTKLDSCVTWKYWYEKIYNDAGIWSNIYPILKEELNELTDNKNKKWCEDKSSLFCVSIESILECDCINDEIFTKENLINMIFNTIDVIWDREVLHDDIIIIKEIEEEFDKEEDK